jgi:molybdopterin synthase sulfur carrier subunit
MKVTVRFFALFGELLGKSKTIDCDTETTVYQLVQMIAKNNEEGYRAIFDESEKFREFVIIMRNGRRIGRNDAADLHLTEGDEIAVFPPVAGG